MKRNWIIRLSCWVAIGSATLLEAPSGLAQDHVLTLQPALAMRPNHGKDKKVADDQRPKLDLADDAGAAAAMGRDVEGRHVELVRERFANGTVRIERQVAQDQEGNFFNHGSWKEFTQRAQLLSEGSYRMGQRHGDWMRWVSPANHADLKAPEFTGFKAPFLSSATFDEGRMHGHWVMVDADQKIIFQMELDQGVRHGAAIWYFPNGQRRRQMFYVQGILDGVATTWKEDKSVEREETYVDGRRRVHNVTYYENDKTKTKAKANENYLAPRRVPTGMDDFWTVNFADYEGEGKNLREGEWAMWHPNGLPQMKGTFQNDVPVGQMTYWYTNGQVRIRGEYQEGQRHGEWVWWHENGMKATQGMYENEQAVGQWMWWTPDGKVAKRVDLDQQPATVNEDGQILTSQD